MIVCYMSPQTFCFMPKATDIKWPARRGVKGVALHIIRLLRVWVQFSMNIEKNMQTITLTV